MTARIFINYRRDDSAGTAGRLHDRLAQNFGRKNLFMDVDHIPAGIDFVEHINSQVAACDIFLAIVGPNWLDSRDENGDRRLASANDFVAIEIAAALTRDIRVIPVLIDGARMPKASELPEPLMPLVRRNAIELRHSHFGRDAEALVAKIREAAGNGSAGVKRWRTGAVAALGAVLLLAGWIGLRGRGIPISLQWPLQPDTPVAQDHNANAVPSAEATAKAEQAERERLAAIKAEQDRSAKAAADVEAKRKSDEAARLSALKAASESKAAVQPFVAKATDRLGCLPVHAQSDTLRFGILPGTADGVKAIQFTAYSADIAIQETSVQHAEDVAPASRQINRVIARGTASAPIRLEDRVSPLSLVVASYSVREGGINQSLCLEGLK